MARKEELIQLLERVASINSHFIQYLMEPARAFELPEEKQIAAKLLQDSLLVWMRTPESVEFVEYYAQHLIPDDGSNSKF